MVKIMSIKLQMKILRDANAGKEYTQARKYRYTIQYHPMAVIHDWIIRQDIRGGSWDWVQPLDTRIRWDRVHKIVYAV